MGFFVYRFTGLQVYTFTGLQVYRFTRLQLKHDADFVQIDGLFSGRMHDKL